MAHTVFVSFDEADTDRVRRFLAELDTGDSFVLREEPVPKELAEKGDPDEVMTEMRDRYLRDSTVTLVLVGRCTWAKRTVDWEVQASLRASDDHEPNGLLAVLLDPEHGEGRLPRRVWLNVETGYAAFQPHPPDAATLAGWIEGARRARDNRAGEVVNDRERQAEDEPCP